MPLFANSRLSLESVLGFCHGIAKGGDCKVVIYNCVFVGFYSVPNLIVILFNPLYPVFIVGLVVRVV